MSYIERVLSWFLKNRIFGGIQKLKQKEYLPFTFILLFIMSVNSTLAILYHFNVLVSLGLVRSMLVLELFLSFGLIISGVLIGKLKSQILYYLIALFVMSLTIFTFIYFNWSYDNPIFKYVKLVYFLTWVAISSISLFFLTLYFFTSFPKKVITLGIPKDHIFLGFWLKLFVYISIAIYAYILIQLDLVSIVFGIFGIINALLVFHFLKRAPKKVESKPGIINFATAIGFYNMFMIYHLYMSVSLTRETVISLILEILMLLVAVLYLVQSMTRRISESPARLIPLENPVRFQSRLYFTARTKKIFGEHGLVLIILGIALGYHMVYLDSFFIIDLPFLSNISPNIKMSDFYHRVYLFFSFLIIIIACFAFKSSQRFKEFMVDKFTINQVFKYIGGLFMRTRDGESQFELWMQELGKKIGARIEGWSNKLQNSIQKIKEGKDNVEDKSKRK